jgi:uncharacterized membrane protein
LFSESAPRLNYLFRQPGIRLRNALVSVCLRQRTAGRVRPMMLPSPSRPARRGLAGARWLEPLLSTLWILFLVWTALLALVWTTGFGDAEVRSLAARLSGSPAGREIMVQPSGALRLSPNEPLPELQGALRWLLSILDPAWIVLATVIVYLSLVAAEGLAVARRWSAMLVGAGFAIAAASAWTGWPLGPIRYTEHFGLRLGRVPLGVPLLWFVVVIGARALAQRIAPRASHAQVALGTGGLAALTALSLEPIAWKVRAFWLWYPRESPAPLHPPLQNYATWFLGAAALGFLLREKSVVRSAGARPRRPIVIFLLLHAVLLLAHGARLLRA